MASQEPIYLNVGCGYSAPEGWTNIDASPTARIERVPLVGGILGKLSGNGQRFPDEVGYGDLTVAGLFAPASVEAVYASHVLEHLALEDMRIALANIHTMLRPGGRLRLIVPDLEERARRYLAQSGNAAAAHAFMNSCYLGTRQRPRGLVGRLRSLFGNAAHLWMWDAASMRHELERAGFVDIRKAGFGDSGDPMFERVERAERFVDDGIEEVALDAFRARA